MATLTETYFHEIVRIRSSGAAVEETSYYPALSNLLNGIGREFKPQITCIMNIATQGAGLPDGGLFTPDQFQRNLEAESALRLLLMRGVIEVKGTGDDVFQVAEVEQISKYADRYNQVLITKRARHVSADAVLRYIFGMGLMEQTTFDC
jgi:hypothetical protein